MPWPSKVKGSPHCINQKTGSPFDYHHVYKKKKNRKMRKLCARDDLFWLFILIAVLLMWIPIFQLSLKGAFVHSWAYTELLINWAGGFVRRGLYGTLAIKFHDLTGYGVVRLTALLFIVITLAQISILFWLLRQYRNNYILIVLVALSPAMLLFPVYDINAYWRKESFLNIAVLAHAMLARLYLTGKVSYRLYKALFSCVLVPLLIMNTLIYEVQVLFLAFHIAMSLSVFRHYALVTPHAKRAEAILVSVAGYCLIIIPFVFSLFAHGDEYKSAVMFESVKTWSGAPADLGFAGWTNAIDAHALSLWASHETAMPILSDPRSFLHYLAAFLLAPVMLTLLIRSQIKNNNGYCPYVWPSFPPLLLFLVGMDYGRWIHMIAISTVAYMLHFPPHSNSPSKVRFASSIYSWLSLFLFLAGIALYTLGWHLPHTGANQNIIGGRFLLVWLDLYHILKTSFDQLVCVTEIARVFHNSPQL